MHNLLAFCNSHKHADSEPDAYIYNGRLCFWTSFSDGTGAWEDAPATMEGARWLLGY